MSKNMINKKIAVILPFEARDVLCDTVIDGLLNLYEQDKSLEIRFPSWYIYPTDLNIKPFLIDENDFIDFANDADLIILIFGKRGTNIALAEKINHFNKTVFIDGSEIGKNRRYDAELQSQILKGTFQGNGRIVEDMLNKCSKYFRREKPYINGIVPLPFGIERRYINYNDSIKKDIDIVCIFGQTEYPPMRKYATELVQDFSRKNNLICKTEITNGFGFDNAKNRGREEFYNILARSKVGISIGGGGFDTARFWEILSNNCILLTESIDILYSDDNSLDFERIIEFRNIYDLEYELKKLLPILKDSSYKNMFDTGEYREILNKHGSMARVSRILESINDKLN